jgi:hypothetical protein
MTDPNLDAKWVAEFEAAGEREVSHLVSLDPDHLSRRRQLAIVWLRQQEKSRKIREKKTYNYVRWTFWAAVGAVIVGIASIVIPWFH